VSEQRVLGSEDILPIIFHGAVYDGKGGFRILDFLSQRPDITIKLETFELQDDNPEDCCWSSSPVVRFAREVEQIVYNSRWSRITKPFLQFGDSLKSLHWNVLHSIHGTNLLLFSGVLDEVAGSLRKLDQFAIAISS
jgi:hypothetical protein